MVNEKIFSTAFTLLYIFLLFLYTIFSYHYTFHYLLYKDKIFSSNISNCTERTSHKFTVLQIFIFVLIEKQIVNHKTCFAIRIDIVRFSQYLNLLFNFIVFS